MTGSGAGGCHRSQRWPKVPDRQSSTSFHLAVSFTAREGGWRRTPRAASRPSPGCEFWVVVRRVTEGFLHHPDVGPTLHQVGGVGVTAACGPTIGDPRGLARWPEPLQAAWRDIRGTPDAEKQRRARSALGRTGGCQGRPASGQVGLEGGEGGLPERQPPLLAALPVTTTVLASRSTSSTSRPTTSDIRVPVPYRTSNNARSSTRRRWRVPRRDHGFDARVGQGLGNRMDGSTSAAGSDGDHPSRTANLWRNAPRRPPRGARGTEVDSRPGRWLSDFARTQRTRDVLRLDLLDERNLDGPTPA